jgi:hypothetical protein
MTVKPVTESLAQCPCHSQLHGTGKNLAELILAESCAISPPQLCNIIAYDVLTNTAVAYNKD